MVQIQQENASTVLNLVYGNNHFELADLLLFKNYNFIPIFTHNDDKKKEKIVNHDMDIKNETKAYDKRKKT